MRKLLPILLSALMLTGCAGTSNNQTNTYRQITMDEAFCGECFFCKKGFVNNCTDKNGGWALGCRIDGGQAEYGRGGLLI